jgi:peptidoglycan/xylan/chitin deacetylase (PgdA/CDA1 family)
MKKKTKKGKKTKQTKKYKAQNKNILPTVLLICFVFAIIFFSYFYSANAQKNKLVNTLWQNAGNQNLISKPYSQLTTKKLTESYTDFKSPSPSPQAFTGYCLRVPVLTYHHIQPQATAVELKQTSLNVDNGMFDQQMAYLAGNGYTSISALTLVEALRNHTGLPGKSVVITMDDGYADSDTYALPVLKKYNLNANLMLATGLVGSNQDMLSWNQVQDMKNSGLFYFTNHTWSHYAVTNGPQSKIESEIDTGASQIKQYIEQDANIFTYPYGSFNNNAIQTLQRKGYIGAFSTIPGQYQCDSFIMTLHRTRIGNSPLSYYGL